MDHYDVHKWLSQITQISDHCIDLLCEDFFEPESLQYIRDTTPKSTLTDFGLQMVAIRDTFENCRQSVNCYDGKIRYHYADIRRNVLGMMMAFELSTIAQSGVDWLPQYFNRPHYLKLLYFRLV